MKVLQKSIVRANLCISNNMEYQLYIAACIFVRSLTDFLCGNANHSQLGVTPLYWAISHGDIEATRMLVKKGGDPNISFTSVSII